MLASCQLPIAIIDKLVHLDLMLVSSVEQSAMQALETQVLVFIGLPAILYSGRA